MSEKKTMELVYLYAVCSTDGKGKLHHAYCPVDKIGEKDEVCYWSKPLGASRRSSDIIGGIYEGEVTVKEDGGWSAVTGAFKCTGRIDDEDQIVEWKAKDTGERGELRRYKQIESMKKDNKMYEALKPIRAAMYKTNSAGRRAILADVIEYLTRGSL